MTSQWHYTSNGVPAGPVTSDDLRKLASEGKLKQTDLVWKDGMKAGVYAESLNNLFSTLPHSESQEETKNTNPFSNYLKNGIKVNVKSTCVHDKGKPGKGPELKILRYITPFSLKNGTL